MWCVVIAGRYPHFDSYSDNYPPYDSSPFQTVPGSVCEGGWGEMGGGGGAHLHHPAFLHREPLPPPTSESKALLQAAGYSGQDQLGELLVFLEFFDTLIFLLLFDSIRLVNLRLRSP